MEPFDLLGKLTKAVCFTFNKDATRPGVTISHLRNGSYYCSIVRHLKTGKLVVLKSSKPSLQEVLTDVSSMFLETYKVRDPMQDLLEALK